MKDLFHYLNSIKDTDILANKEKIRNKISKLFPDNLIDDEIAHGLFVLHFPSFTYLYTSDQEKTFGKDFTSQPIENMNEFLAKNHPLDRKIFEEKMHPFLFNFLKDIQPDDLGDWLFTYNLRIINENEDVPERTFVNRNFFVMNDKREVIFTFGKVVEISSFSAGTPGKITLSCMHWTDDGVKEHVEIFSLDDDHHFSKREKEVLSLIKEGYSSQKIAEELYISIHTVNKHRKNMLKKSGFKNSAELINYGINSGII